MKKSLALLFVLALVTACGPKKEKKKSFEYKRTTNEKKLKKRKLKKPLSTLKIKGLVRSNR